MKSEITYFDATKLAGLIRERKLHPLKLFKPSVRIFDSYAGIHHSPAAIVR